MREKVKRLPKIKQEEKTIRSVRSPKRQVNGPKHDGLGDEPTTNLKNVGRKSKETNKSKRIKDKDLTKPDCQIYL